MKITKIANNHWRVGSERSGNAYNVQYRGSGDGDPEYVRVWDCDCPAGKFGKMCRHVKAVSASVETGDLPAEQENSREERDVLRNRGVYGWREWLGY